MKCSFPIQGPQVVKHGGYGVSHSCLLIELGPVFNSMAASLCFKRFEDHSLLKIYNGDLWKNIYGSGLFYGEDVLSSLPTNAVCL